MQNDIIRGSLKSKKKIVFVDMDKIITTSNAGKKVQSSLDKFAKKENQKFDSIESNLKKKRTRNFKTKKYYFKR